MAKRIVYIPTEYKIENRYVRKELVTFEYCKGCSASNRLKSSKKLQEEFSKIHGDQYNILEVSSFSDKELGKKLSAFSLLLKDNQGILRPVENYYQAGKITETYGVLSDLLDCKPKAAKLDPRVKDNTIGYEYNGYQFKPDQGYTDDRFYNFLYLTALHQEHNSELASQLLEYNAFCDIVANPDKGAACQAEACALYVSLMRKSDYKDYDIQIAVCHPQAFLSKCYRVDLLLERLPML